MVSAGLWGSASLDEHLGREDAWVSADASVVCLVQAAARLNKAWAAVCLNEGFRTELPNHLVRYSFSDGPELGPRYCGDFVGANILLHFPCATS